jgi:DNA-binding transcriptional MerR regulator
MAQHEAAMVKEHRELFMSLGQRVAALDLEIAGIKPVVERMENDLYNSGDGGLLKLFTTFTVAHDATEAERDKALAQQTQQVAAKLEEYHRKQSFRLAVFAIILTLLGLLLGGPAAIKAWKEAMNDVPNFFHLSITGQVYSVHNVPQTAGEARKQPWQLSQ